MVLMLLYDYHAFFYDSYELQRSYVIQAHEFTACRIQQEVPSQYSIYKPILVKDSSSPRAPNLRVAQVRPTLKPSQAKKKQCDFVDIHTLNFAVPLSALLFLYSLDRNKVLFWVNKMAMDGIGMVGSRYLVIVFNPTIVSND